MIPAGRGFSLRKKSNAGYKITDVGQGFSPEPMVLTEPEVSLAFNFKTLRNLKVAATFIPPSFEQFR